MKRELSQRANDRRNGDGRAVKTGKPDVKPEQSSHVPGVRTGNQIGNLEKEPGLAPLEDGAVGNARRSTGIAPEDREPIDPRMPHLSPP